MIEKGDIDRVLDSYDDELTIGVVCSHSALQLIHGAKREGFRTLAICPEEREETYRSFPAARADDFLTIRDFPDLLDDGVQETLRDRNTIIIPHGSFVEYVGPENLKEGFEVPVFGNRESLSWEGDRGKERKWLEWADVNVPTTYDDPSEVDGSVFVKFPGAKGGRGFFIAESRDEYEAKMDERLEKGLVTEEDAENATIQEFLPGIRFYPHYFYSPYEERGFPAGDGAVELLGMDRRIETIDESYRGLPEVPEAFFDYTVLGNEGVVIRESLLGDALEMAASVIEVSLDLFPPGMVGPFCLETVFHPDTGFTVFEVSGRIVAGTNVYPEGSPYSAYYFDEPMSTGRRIAREIGTGRKRGELDKVVY